MIRIPSIGLIVLLTAVASPSLDAVQALKSFLGKGGVDSASIEKQTFASVELSREEAKEARALLWRNHFRWIKQKRAEEMKARTLVDGDARMRFFYSVHGERPREGRSLYISMHGGGGTTRAVNDRQWENQKRLYRIEEG
ncbi:MAG: polyhydroxyalkanoate depolymerase, partial [Verrucomicrobiota bacterium]